MRLERLVDHREVVSYHRAFAAYDKAHSDALSLIVMGAVQEVHSTHAGAETKRGAHGLAGRTAGNERPHERVGFTHSFAQATLCGDRVDRDQACQNAEANFVLNAPKRSSAGTILTRPRTRRNDDIFRVKGRTQEKQREKVFQISSALRLG
jgi:hypothetical protein